MISYSPLWETMKKRDISTYTLIHKYGINPRTINNLKHNKSITMFTLERLCEILNCEPNDVMLMLSWAVMISLCHADMRLPGYLSWNVSFDGADLSAPSRKELVHTSMLCQHFKRRDDGTGICLFHSAVMPEAFLIPEEICQ